MFIVIELTQVFWPLELSVDHPNKKVGLARKDVFDLNFELHIRVENVQRLLAKHYSVLVPVFLNRHLIRAHLQSVCAPLSVKQLC